jgi:hypothetical protein
LDDVYPQRETRPWRYGGIQFYSKATTTTFYNKWKREQIPPALGLLRHETSMRGAINVADRMKVEQPTLRDLRVDWLAGVLSKDLKVLHLDDAIICDRDLALEILSNKYEPTKATRLYGYLVQRQTLSKEQMLTRGYKPRTLQDWNKQLSEAGVALTMTDKVALPPLSLDMGAVSSVGTGENVDDGKDEMAMYALPKQEADKNAQKNCGGS